MSKRGTSSRLDVIVAGLAVVDVIGRTVQLDKLPKKGGLRLIDSITLTTGGNVANVAIDLAKLGFRAGAITRIGRDGLGDFVRSELARHDIDTRGITIDPHAQTSATMVAVGPDGERTFLHTRGALRRFRVSDVLRHLPMIARSRILAFGYYGLLPECEPDLKRLFTTIKHQTNARILVDTGGNPSPKSSRLTAFLPFIDYFIPSLEEAMACTGRSTPKSIVEFLISAGARGVVGVKMGARGCYVAANGEARFVPSFTVRHVLDATGAGDAFVSGFLAATLRGHDPFTAAAIGNAVAASSIKAVGASTAIRPFEAYAKPAGRRRTGIRVVVPSSGVGS